MTVSDKSTTVPLIPLGRRAHQYAQQFASEQRHPDKGSQVYLNTLSVYAVHCYLQRLQIQTDLNQSDSWNAAMRILFDLADLMVLNVGKLECRPLSEPDDPMIMIPAEVLTDRVGYLVVKLNPTLDQAQLLGFIPADQLNETRLEINLDQLEPCSSLLAYITEVESSNLQQPGLTKIQRLQSVKLYDWLQGLFEVDWRPLELFPTPALNLRGSDLSTNLEPTLESLKRGQVITLTHQDQMVQILKILILKSKSEDEVEIKLVLQPYETSNHLPRGLRITLLDEKESPCMEVQSERDNRITLEFDARLGESFSTLISLGDSCVQQTFVV